MISNGKTDLICNLLNKIEMQLIKYFQLKGGSSITKIFESQIQNEQERLNIIETNI